MRLNIRSLFLFAFVGIIGFTMVISPANGLAQASMVEKFDYSAVNQQEWLSMDRADRVAACQIPDDVVDDMSTEVLFASVLDYPFLIDILAFSDPRHGFLHVYDEFPALQALLQRDDFGVVAREYMESIKLHAEENVIENIYVEALLKQPEVYEKIDALGPGSFRTKTTPFALTWVYTPNGTPVSVQDNSRIDDWTREEIDYLNA